MKKIYILAFAMLLLSLQNKAQWVQLNDTLLQGAALQQLVQTNNSIIAITTSGLFQTSDKGQNWSYIQGIDSASNYNQGIALMNNNIYVQKTNSRSLLKHANGNWTELSSNGIPNNGGNWGLGGANGLLFTYFSNDIDTVYLYYSSDGTNWLKGLFLGSQNQGGNTNFLFLNNSKQYFYFKDSLFYTTNGLNKIAIPSPSGYTSNQFSNGNISGELNGNYIYYTGKSNDIYRMNTNIFPLQWENISSNITNLNNIFIPQIAVSDSAIFTNVISQSLNAATFLRSTDHGATFTEINLENCGLSIAILSKVISIDPGKLICQDMSNDLFYSNDNGTTWVKRDNGLLAVPSGNLINRNGILYNRLVNDGGTSIIIKSTDNGSTWTEFVNGLPQIAKPPFKESLVFIDGLFELNNQPYVIAEDFNNNQLPEVFRLDTINDIWVKTIAQPGPNPSRLVYLGNNHNTFFLINNRNDSIWRTIDGGQSWTDITSAISSFNLQQIYNVKGKGESDTLFIFGRSNYGSDRILLSVDNGNNWSSFYTVNNGNIQLDINNNNSNSAHAVCDFGGSNKTFIIVINQYNNYHTILSDQLYTLKNGALEILNTTGLPKQLNANCIKFINSKWFLGTTVGMFFSVNGINWSPITNNSNYYLGMLTEQIYVIDKEMFIGTNTGIWKNDLSVGVNNITKADNNIRMYPNPVNDVLNINVLTTNNYQLSTNIDIYSLVGEKVYSETTKNNNFRIDFSEFSKGLYLVRVKNGEDVYTRKIIK